MTEQARVDAPAASYGVYLKAWVVLLLVTILMVIVANPAFLIAGMTLKALIITLYFMHLRYERLDFVLYVLCCTFVTAFVLFGLIATDGMNM